MKVYYQDEFVTIYHGDCRDILPSLPKVDLVLTDPPYNKVNRVTHGLRKIDKGIADDGDFDLPFMASEFVRVGKSIYVWCGTEQVSHWRAAFVDAGLSTRLCIWEKSNPSPMNGEHLWLSSVEACVYAKAAGATFNGFCASPVWRGPTEGFDGHPTAKPSWLMEKLVLASSNDGDTALDPFMGSGTTIRAALNLGRKAIGIEIEERYCEIAANRCRQMVLL